MNLPAISDNKNVIQSYILTSARYDFSAYEKRILYRLVELAQMELPGHRMKDLVGYQLETNLLGDKEITLPLRSILAHEEYNHLDLAKKAFRRFTNRVIEEVYNNGETFRYTHLIERVKIDMGTGLASFRVAPYIWASILNFTKGYRKFELKTTMQFKSAYSMRMYELMSGQTTPLIYGIEDLRAMFRVENKYTIIAMFEKRVLDVAKAELDEHSPYSFTYKRNTIRGRGRGGERTVGYTFYPRPIMRNKDEAIEKKELVAQLHITSLLPRNFYEYLLDKGLTKEQMSVNKKALYEFCKTSPDPMGQAAIAWSRAREKGRSQVAYFIGTLMRMTEEAKSKTKDTVKAKVTTGDVQDKRTPVVTKQMEKDALADLENLNIV